MDFFDPILPKPIRTEEFTFYSDRDPELLVHEIQVVFEKTRGFVFSPNLTGEFTSTYSFRARPKWTLLVINNYMGPAVRLNGEVNAHGSGSVVSVELHAHWTLGLFALFPPSLALLWLIMVPKDRLPSFSFEGSIVPVGLLLLFPAFALLSAWTAKRFFKRSFIRCFNLKLMEGVS